MNITPNADKILLEIIPLTEEEKRVGALWIPEQGLKKTIKPRGRVVKVGIGKFSPAGTYIPCYSRVGDLVEYTETSRAVAYQISGKPHLMLPEAEIHGWLDLDDDDAMERLDYFIRCSGKAAVEPINKG